VSARRWIAGAAVALGVASVFVFATGWRSPFAFAAPPFSLLGEPLDVRADQVEVDVEANGASALLTGHVELARKDLRVVCPRVEARFDKDGRVQTAHATGRVVVVLGERGLRGEADEVRLDLGSRTAELRGNVRVAQGASSLTAERATVDLVTSRVALETVRGTFAGTGASALGSASLPASPTASGTAPPAPAAP
jgi:lipopolysaccharide export system protein LptA